MKILSGYLAVFYFVLGLKKFNNKKYVEAATIFEKVCKLDPSNKRSAFFYSYLGRSYLELKEYDLALKNLVCSYKIFKVNHLTDIDEFERNTIIVTLEAYRYLLEKNNDRELSKIISIELNQFQNE